MANKASAVILLIALIIGGVFITFNLVDVIYPNSGLGIGFDNISGVMSFIWIVAVRLVGVVLIGLPSWVIYKIITD